MEVKINIAEILKNKPQGIRLYSPIFGECVFCHVCEDTDDICVRYYGEKAYFNPEGLYNTLGEVMLFPSKSMQDWSKFAWKKGDVLVSNDGRVKVIFEKFRSDTYQSFIGKYHLDSLECNNPYYQHEGEYATGNFKLEEVNAAQTYINTIEEKLGGKLNLETLEIEPAQPEFKDGDILSCDEDSYTRHTILILHKDENITESIVSLVRHRELIEDNIPINTFLLSRLYYAREDEKKELFDALTKEGKAWDAEKKMIVDLEPKVGLKPFDKVLVRDSASDKWRANLFGYIGKDGYYCCVYANWNYCIPYIGNEHLLGTTKDVK